MSSQAVAEPEIKSALEATIEKLKALPPDKLLEAKEFVEFLHGRSAPKRARKSLEGLWVGLGQKPVTAEDIAEVRKEMFGGHSPGGV